MAFVARTRLEAGSEEADLYPRIWIRPILSSWVNLTVTQGLVDELHNSVHFLTGVFICSQFTFLWRMLEHGLWWPGGASPLLRLGWSTNGMRSTWTSRTTTSTRTDSERTLSANGTRVSLLFYQVQIWSRALQILAPFHQQLSEVSNYLAFKVPSSFSPVSYSILLHLTPSTATSVRVYTQWCLGIHGVSNYRIPPLCHLAASIHSAVLASTLATLHVFLSPSDSCLMTLNLFA